MLISTSIMPIEQNGIIPQMLFIVLQDKRLLKMDFIQSYGVQQQMRSTDLTLIRAAWTWMKKSLHSSGLWKCTLLRHTDSTPAINLEAGSSTRNLLPRFSVKELLTLLSSRSSSTQVLLLQGPQLSQSRVLRCSERAQSLWEDKENWRSILTSLCCKSFIFLYYSCALSFSLQITALFSWPLSWSGSPVYGGGHMVATLRLYILSELLVGDYF